jgi:hypothetical protein
MAGDRAPIFNTVYGSQRIIETRVRRGQAGNMGRSGGGCAMMSLPFLLFACGLGAAWLRQRGAAMGFWVAGLVVLLVLFRVHMSGILNIAL